MAMYLGARLSVGVLIVLFWIEASGAITWKFVEDNNAQGWQARENLAVGSATASRLRAEVQDGIWRIFPAPFEPGRTPTVTLISPPIGHDSALFDRVAIRFRVVHTRPISGALSLEWVNDANRQNPSSIEERDHYLVVDSGLVTFTTDWQEVVFGDLRTGPHPGMFSPILWEGELTEFRLNLVLADVSPSHSAGGYAEDVPQAVELDRIVLTGVEEQLQGELPAPVVDQREPFGALFAPAVFNPLGQQGISHILNNYNTSAVLGDLDGDGDLDLVASYHLSSRYPVDSDNGWLETFNNGRGEFVQPRLHPEKAGGLAYVQGADVDVDGFLDVYVLSSLGDTQTRLWRNDTRGGWEMLEVFEDLYPLGLVDGDGDGDADLWMFGYVREEERVSLWLLRNDGDGHFAGRQEVRLESSAQGYAPAYLVQHLGGGRTTGVLWAHRDSPGYKVTYLNSNGETVQEHLAVELTSEDTQRLRYVGDYDLDGDVDLIVGDDFFSAPVGVAYRSLSLWRNSGDGTFAVFNLYEEGEITTGVSVLDLDADGRLDLVVMDSDQRAPAVLVFLGSPDGVPFLEGRYPLRGQGGAAIGGDVDGDGDVDLVVLERNIESEGGVHVLFNRRQGAMTDSTSDRQGESLGEEEGPDRNDTLSGILDEESEPTVWLPQESEWMVYNSTNSGLPDQKITDMAIDTQKRLWVGTAGGGLVRYDGGRWMALTVENSELPGSIISRLAFDTRGRLWVGMGKMSSRDPGGLVRFDGLEWVVYNQDNSPLPDDGVTALIIDHLQDGVWVGTMGGLVQLDDEGWTVYTADNSALPGDFIASLSQDSQGRLWVGTGDGLACLEGENWQVYTTTNSELPDDEIWGLSQDSQGRLWVGTRGGLACLEGENWQVYTTTNSELPENSIASLNVDGGGGIWIGTKRGELVRYKGGIWTTYNMPVRAPTIYENYAIGRILIDDFGNKWLASYGGGLIAYREGGVFLPVSITAVEQSLEPAMPAIGVLNPSYPNPFNSQTWIPFEVPAGSGPVDLRIYNILGQPVRTLVTGALRAGQHVTPWDGRDQHGQEVGSGLYFYRLRAGAWTATGKMVKSE